MSIPFGKLPAGKFDRMDVFDRRRARLGEMLKAISQAELARKSGVAASYISRCLKEPGDDGYKTIGELTARKLEKGARKQEGWLDAPVGTATLTPSGLAATLAAVPPGNPEWEFEGVDEDRYRKLSLFAQGAAQKAMMDEVEKQERMRVERVQANGDAVQVHHQGAEGAQRLQDQVH